MKRSGKEWFLKGLKDGVPIAAGYFAVSIAIGAAAAQIGMRPLLAVLMSAGMAASAGQAAAISLIGAGAGVFEMVLTTFVVNMRYCLMSSSLSQKFDEGTPFWKKAVVAFYVTDEIFGLESAVEGSLSLGYMLGLSLISVTGWSAGTAVGVLAGNVLPDAVMKALSASLYGMFLAIIVPPVKKNRFIGLLILLSMALSAVFAFAPLLGSVPSGYRIIILTLALSAFAAKARPVEEEGA